MNEQKSIFQSLCNINKEIEAIGKAKKNVQQNFMYRGIDDVMNELHDLFAKHEVFITIECLERVSTEKITKSGGVMFYTIEKIKYTFHAVDGSSVSCVIDGEAMDSGDKSTNKSMSVALKYCLLQMFLIPTEEMKDPDANAHELMPSKKQQQSDSAKIEKAMRLLNACEIMSTIETMDKLKLHWTSNKEFQTEKTFIDAKNKRKEELTLPE